MATPVISLNSDLKIKLEHVQGEDNSDNDIQAALSSLHALSDIPGNVSSGKLIPSSTAATVSSLPDATGTMSAPEDNPAQQLGAAAGAQPSTAAAAPGAMPPGIPPAGMPSMSGFPGMPMAMFPGMPHQFPHLPPGSEDQPASSQEDPITTKLALNHEDQDEVGSGTVVNGTVVDGQPFSMPNAWGNWGMGQGMMPGMMPPSMMGMPGFSMMGMPQGMMGPGMMPPGMMPPGMPGAPPGMPGMPGMPPAAAPGAGPAAPGPVGGASTLSAGVGSSTPPPGGVVTGMPLAEFAQQWQMAYQWQAMCYQMWMCSMYGMGGGGMPGQMPGGMPGGMPGNMQVRAVGLRRVAGGLG